MVFGSFGHSPLPRKIPPFFLGLVQGCQFDSGPACFGNVNKVQILRWYLLLLLLLNSIIIVTGSKDHVVRCDVLLTIVE